MEVSLSLILLGINLLMLELQIFSYIKFKTYQSEKNQVRK